MIWCNAHTSLWECGFVWVFISIPFLLSRPLHDTNYSQSEQRMLPAFTFFNLPQPLVLSFLTYLSLGPNRGQFFLLMDQRRSSFCHLGRPCLPHRLFSSHFFSQGSCPRPVLVNGTQSPSGHMSWVAPASPPAAEHRMTVQCWHFVTNKWVLVSKRFAITYLEQGDVIQPFYSSS